MSDLRCAACGFERKEHSYNGACYGVCGEFQAMSEKGDIEERLEHYAKRTMPHYPNDLCSDAKREIVSLRAQLRLAFFPFRLQARPADGGEWTDIYPAQLQSFAKGPYEVRAIELPLSDELRQEPK